MFVSGVGVPRQLSVQPVRWWKRHRIDPWDPALPRQWSLSKERATQISFGASKDWGFPTGIGDEHHTIDWHDQHVLPLPKSFNENKNYFQSEWVPNQLEDVPQYSTCKSYILPTPTTLHVNFNAVDSVDAWKINLFIFPTAVKSPGKFKGRTPFTGEVSDKTVCALYPLQDSSSPCSMYLTYSDRKSVV